MDRYNARGGSSSPVRIVERTDKYIRVHMRPGYTMSQAQRVADWLNGYDMQLHTKNEHMVRHENGSWYEVRRRHDIPS